MTNTKEYQREYYQKNKERINKRRRELRAERKRERKRKQTSLQFCAFNYIASDIQTMTYEEIIIPEHMKKL